MSRARPKNFPTSRAHLYFAFTQRFEAARSEREGLQRFISQLSGQISQNERVLSSKERERSELLFRRPRTAQANQQLEVLEQEMKSLNADVEQLRRARHTAEHGIHLADAEMVAARTTLDTELEKLE